MAECIKNLYYIKQTIDPSKEEILANVIAKAGADTKAYQELTVSILKKEYPHLSPLEIMGAEDFINSKASDIYEQVIEGRTVLAVNQGGTKKIKDKMVFSKYHLLLREESGLLCAVIFQTADKLKILEKSNRQGLGKKDSITAGKFFTVFGDIRKLKLVSIHPDSGTKKKPVAMIEVSRNEVDMELFYKALIEEKKNCFLCSKKHQCDFHDSLNLLKGSTITETSNVSADWQVPKLNQEQKAVIAIRNGIIRVIAGPGSGKTTTVVSHCKELIDEGYAGEDILFLSFTKNAVNEVRDRIMLMAKANYYNSPTKLNAVYNIQFINYNGLGNKAAAENIHQKFRSEPKVINKVDALLMLGKIIEESDLSKALPVSYDRPFSKESVCPYLLKRIEETKKVMVEHIAENREYQIPEDIRYYYEAYESEKTDRNLIDYNDQLLILMDYLVSNEMNYRIIFVDEFQDSNKAHIAILKYLERGAEGMFFVGDPNQAMFSFNGVHPDNMLNLHKIFDNVKTMYLTTNYRSCEEIIHASNILISYSDNYSQMPMKGLRAGGVVKAIPVRNKNDIVEYYLNHISPDRKVLVLCSTNNECKNLSSAFIDQLVPVSLVYAITYDLLHALKNFISAIIRHDINYVPYALSVLKQKQLQQVTEKEIKYAYKKLRAIGEKENAYLPLREYFNELNSIEADINVFDILDDAYISSIEKAFQYLRIYLDSSDIERKSIISRFDDNNQSNANVKVSTIHTAKGSESPIVILDGTSFRKTTRRPITDEDIRTLYVAMTRAKSELYFMHNDDISEKSNALEYYVYSAIQEALSRPVKRAM